MTDWPSSPIRDERYRELDLPSPLRAVQLDREADRRLRSMPFELQRAVTASVVLSTVVLTLNAFGCGVIREQDEARLESLRDRFGNRVSITPEAPYLKLKVLQENVDVPTLAYEVFSGFWMDGAMARPNSEFVYLNVYDARDRFQFQLYFNPATQQIERGSVEYH